MWLSQLLLCLLSALVLDLSSGLAAPKNFLMPIKLQLIEKYVQLKGSSYIPEHFVIPSHQDANPEHKEEAKLWPEFAHGVHLGNTVRRIRFRGPSFMKTKYPREYETLTQLGFSWEINAVMSMRAKVDLIEKFYKLYGHANIPYDFVIPAGVTTWPQESVGIDLGEIAQSIVNHKKTWNKKYPQLYEKLNELKFDVKNTNVENTYIRLFDKYYELHGHLKVPTNYMIPSNSTDWPVEYHGINFGDIFNTFHQQGKILCQKRYPRLYESLNSKNYDWTMKAAGMSVSAKIQVLREFYDTFGHLDIRSPSQIPSKSLHSKEYYGIYLYDIVKSLRYRNEKYLLQHYPEIHQELTQKGFAWKPVNIRIKKKESSFLPILEHYYSIHNHLNIPTTFIVPKDDINWPENFWGKELGRYAASVRLQGREYMTERNPTVVDKLDEMKFPWETKSSNCLSADFKKELVTFCYEKFNGDLSRVNKSFVVAEDDLTWPEQYRGQAVGKLIMKLKKQHVPVVVVENKVENHVQVLEKIGRKKWPGGKHFDDGKWISVLHKYYELHGTLSNIIGSYKTPVNDTNWPKEMQNLLLGRLFSNARSNGEDFYQEKYPELYEVLTRYKFDWNPSARDTTTEEKVELIKKYYEIHGNVSIPLLYVIPEKATEKEPWPDKYLGVSLGNCVANLRKIGEVEFGKQYPSLHRDLQYMGFTWIGTKLPTFEEKVQFFRFYYELYGDLGGMHRHYNLPETPEIPKKFWGYRLGRALIYLEHSKLWEEYQKVYPDLCTELVDMGFVYLRKRQ